MPADSTDLRRSVYLLLGAAAVAVAAAKVVGAENVVEPSRYKAPGPGGYGIEPDRKWPDTRPEPTPMFGSNDRSRWATVRALVDEGTYVIGRRENFRQPTGYTDTGIVFEDGYQSLDKVMDPQTGLFYSSKPPLFATVLAGEYWLLKKLFGWSIVSDRWLVVPTILLTVNVIPFAVYLFLLGRLLDTTGTTDFGRLLAFTTACFGTFLITFSGTLNNHVPGAFCALFAAYPVVRSAAEGRDMTPREYTCCGFFAGLAVTFELPAAALLAGLGIPLLVARPRPTLLFFVPLALLPIAALLVTNYLAIGELVPAYAKFGREWYNYPGSHWARLGTPDAKGIDFADEPKAVYAFHLLLGHHGWFSLTPVWFVALAGLVGLGIRSAADVRKLLGGGRGSPWTLPLFSAMTLAVSLVVIGFYIYRTNNYGGFTSGPRWLMWLTPLWLLAIPAAADRLAGSRPGRVLSAVLLGASAFSAFYPAWNPWRPPWLLQLMEYTGWLRY
jgi:hypothetical protein